MLWACLRFPQLALDALRIDADVPSPGPAGAGSSFRSRSGSGSFSSASTAPATPARSTPAHAGSAPLAIIDGPLQRRYVVSANAAAAKAGVRAGQVLAAAQMLCPRLATTPRDEAAERQTLESLAAWAYRYSAEIHIAFPDTLLVEVGSSLALFDGWAALERRLRHELGDLGFACSLGAAPTAAGALVLATHRDGITIPSPSQLPTALGTVPLTASGLTGKTVAALQGMGFRTLADLFRLPRAELGRRIGEDALDHLDRMRGLVGEALPRWHPPGRFERRIEFNFGIETHTALAFPLQRLIRELALFLVTRDGGVQKFSLRLGHERGASMRVDIGLLAPQRDAASLFDLARARLERIELAAPVHALSLIADDLPPLCPLHQDLFDHRRREELDWPALAERLRARLGDVALHGLASAADHRPDQAWRFVAATAQAISGGSGFSRDAPIAKMKKRKKGIAAEAAHTGQVITNPEETTCARHVVSSGIPMKSRPFWLLHRPMVLRESPSRILSGPERIESGWWDERDQRRDYYIIETRRGQRAWAFVEAGKRHAFNEITRAGVEAPWMLHGWFA